MHDGASARPAAPAQAAPGRDRSAVPTGDAASFARLVALAQQAAIADDLMAMATLPARGAGSTGGSEARPASQQAPQLSPQQLPGHVAAQARAMREQRKALRIDLNPEHLGPLVVEMQRDGAQLGVHLRASSEQAAAALEGQLQVLLERLAGLGFAGATVRVSVDPEVAATTQA